MNDDELIEWVTGCCNYDQEDWRAISVNKFKQVYKKLEELALIKSVLQHEALRELNYSIHTVALNSSVLLALSEIDEDGYVISTLAENTNIVVFCEHAKPILDEALSDETTT